jgi:hypothetical protein
MNLNQLKHNMQQLKSTVIDHWDWFIDEQLDAIESNQRYFTGSAQMTYVISDEEAEQRLAAWQQQQRAKFRKQSGSSSLPL